MNHSTRSIALLWCIAIAFAALVWPSSEAEAATSGATTSPSADMVEPSVAWPGQDPELPREWRWTRKAISFDHMYRQR